MTTDELFTMIHNVALALAEEFGEAGPSQNDDLDQCLIFLCQSLEEEFGNEAILERLGELIAERLETEGFTDYKVNR